MSYFASALAQTEELGENAGKENRKKPARKRDIHMAVTTRFGARLVRHAEAHGSLGLDRIA